MKFVPATVILCALAVSGCAQINKLTGRGEADVAATAPMETTAPVETAAAAPVPKASAKRAADFDTTSAAQKAEAAKAPTKGEVKLGTTVASLGDPTNPGFWVKTPLVKENAKGRIVNPASGKSAKVDLIPLSGPASGGSQVSLPALQLIGVSLTDLPEIEVYRN